MSAWSHRSFDNDAAADWADKFDQEGVAAVASALAQVAEFPEDKYLEDPEASAAIAAAEIVASARDGDVSGLSECALEVFRKYQCTLTDPQLLHLSQRAFERIFRQSELKELWEETPNKFDSELWFKAMDSLSSRLR